MAQSNPIQYPKRLTDEQLDAMIADAHTVAKLRRAVAEARRIEANRLRALGVVVSDLDNDTPTPDVFGYDDFVEGE